MDQRKRRRVFSGARLRELRRGQDLTRIELSDLSGVSPRAIAYFELGERQPLPGTIKKLAQGLEVRVADFFTWDNDERKAS